MLFNSVHFLLFFPLVTILYFLLPYKYRWALLLIASYYFYMSWNPAYIILIILSTVIDYTAGIMMEKSFNRKKFWLSFSLITNLGLLFTFKYLGFFTREAQSVLELLHIPAVLPQFKLLLPVGISFYTFQTLSYSLDVYMGKIKAERHFGIFALYVSFFPQLVAGPIERSGNLLPQFYKKNDFDYERIVSGLRLMAFGMFKKVVIADRAAVIVDLVYNNVHSYSNGAFFGIATLAFAFQIYCDFSGYSDIAIGAANVLGYDLMTNFDRPYSSKSIAEFWRRWHISLSTWFKDYIYIPLGGSRVGLGKWVRNTLVVFLVSGLWHGANWTFIIWGALHGAVQVFMRLTQKIRDKLAALVGLVRLPRLQTFINCAATFAFVNFAWIFFRANTISDAFYIVLRIFTKPHLTITLSSFNRLDLIILALSILIMEIAQYVGSVRRKQGKTFSQFPALVRWGAYVFLVGWIFIFARFGNQEFIYFQF